MRYACDVCGWVYDETGSAKDWETVPADFECELCGAGKEQFSPEN